MVPVIHTTFLCLFHGHTSQLGSCNESTSGLSAKDLWYIQAEQMRAQGQVTSA